MSRDPPQIPFRHTGKVPNPQAEDRPLEADDLLFYIGETSMPMAAFMRQHGLFMDTDGLHFDLTQFGAIRTLAEKVISEHDAGRLDGVRKELDLSGDEDADYDGGYPDRPCRARPPIWRAKMNTSESRSRRRIAMDEYDLYLNVKKPAVGLYVRKGAGLPDLADKKDWVFGGTAAQDLLPAAIVASIAANGHAFQDMD